MHSPLVGVSSFHFGGIELHGVQQDLVDQAVVDGGQSPVQGHEFSPDELQVPPTHVDNAIWRQWPRRPCLNGIHWMARTSFWPCWENHSTTAFH